MKNKFALVTGASTGIGRVIAIELAKTGIHVGLVARTGDRLKETKRLIEEENGQAEIFIADLSKIESINNLTSQVKNKTDKDLYFVAVKVFLEKDGKFLIFKDGFGQWDLPGGRIKKDEFYIPLEQVIARKMSEELGGKIKYTLGKPIIFMRHQRVENTQGSPTVRIFAVGYEATLDEGKPEMKSHHTEILWVDPNNFKPEDYFTGGWLKGVQEYLRLCRAEK